MEEKNYDEKNIFHGVLEQVYDSLQKNNTKKKMYEDFSVQGWESQNKQVIKKNNLHPLLNDNEKEVINFATFKDLIVSST